ncbi:Proliferation-associated protein 2G4 [Thoreauomyces humboldtii]|nr:Proliferation-associated protein 2G4 [Thoreauomyces humboldtii]
MSLMDISQPTIDRLDQDNNLADPAVVTKYRLGADIANAVMKQLLSYVVIGARIIDVCATGDALLLAETDKVHKKGERGIARPTCLCVNNVVRNSTPVDDTEVVVLRDGDLVKIDFGVHIDGYISLLAHTTVLTSDPSTPTTGRQADVVCAAHYASTAALNLLVPGTTTSDITMAIANIAEHFGCMPVATTFSRQVKRFLLNSGTQIHNSPDEGGEEEMEGDVVIEAGDVYVIDVVLSTGSGEVKEIQQQRPNVLVRDVNRFYNLKSKASRSTLAAAADTFSVFPFAQRNLLGLAPMHRLGIQELLAHGLLVPELMQIESTGEHVARFAATVLVRSSTNGGPLRITASDLPLPYVHSEIDIGTSEHAALATNARPKSVKTKKIAAVAAMDMS